LARFGLDETLTYRIILGVGEALANAIEHGSDMDAKNNVSVEVFTGDDTIRATVSDAGQWSTDSAASRRSADGGLGLTLINGLADSVDTVRTARGTSVTVQFPRALATFGTGDPL
jgi:anti-sigma regulatory factor (Ser/Thr protein kinase)